MKTPKALNYSDICLIPRFSSLKTRSDASVITNWSHFSFSSPLCPANMSSVINEDLAAWCATNNIPYFYHRFGDTRSFVRKMNLLGLFTSISVGVKETDKNLIDHFVKSGAHVDMVLIDVAHGYSQLVCDMIKYVKERGFFVVAGNIWGDKDSIDSLTEWGADAIKVGLAKGAGCSTYNQTGFASPMFTAAIEAGKWSTVPLIIDGGIRNNGDIVKAIRAVLQYSDGIPLVMAGSLLAACIDAPGENVYDGPVSIYPDLPMPKIIYKQYYGSASTKQKGNKNHVEGFEVSLPCNQMTYAEKYQEVKESLQSAISYAGGSSLIDIKHAEFVEI